MSLSLASLVFLHGAPGSAGPMRIKIDQGRGAILAFRTAEVARHFASRWGFEPMIACASDLEPETVRSGDLLVFDSVEQIDAAYENVATYDFSKHVRAWTV
jgi:hypothetical protein